MRIFSRKQSHTQSQNSQANTETRKKSSNWTDVKFLTIAIGLDEEGNRMEIVVWGVQLVASCTYFLFKRKKCTLDVYPMLPLLFLFPAPRRRFVAA